MVSFSNLHLQVSSKLHPIHPVTSRIAKKTLPDFVVSVHVPLVDGASQRVESPQIVDRAEKSLRPCCSSVVRLFDAVLNPGNWFEGRFIPADLQDFI